MIMVKMYGYCRDCQNNRKIIIMENYFNRCNTSVVTRQKDSNKRNRQRNCSPKYNSSPGAGDQKESKEHGGRKKPKIKAERPGACQRGTCKARATPKAQGRSKTTQRENTGTVKSFPLGRLGRVGMNITAFEYNNNILIW